MSEPVTTDAELDALIDRLLDYHEPIAFMDLILHPNTKRITELLERRCGGD